MVLWSCGEHSIALIRRESKPQKSSRPSTKCRSYSQSMRRTLRHFLGGPFVCDLVSHMEKRSCDRSVIYTKNNPTQLSVMRSILHPAWSRSINSMAHHCCILKRSMVFLRRLTRVFLSIVFASKANKRLLGFILSGIWMMLAIERCRSCNLRSWMTQYRGSIETQKFSLMLFHSLAHIFLWLVWIDGDHSS